MRYDRLFSFLPCPGVMFFYVNVELLSNTWMLPLRTSSQKHFRIDFVHKNHVQYCMIIPFKYFILLCRISRSRLSCSLIHRSIPASNASFQFSSQVHFSYHHVFMQCNSKLENLFIHHSHQWFSFYFIYLHKSFHHHQITQAYTLSLPQ